MFKYFLRRLTYAVFILFFGSLIVYTVIRFLPTSYVENIARQRSNLPGAKSYSQILANLNSVYGLDTDIFTGFLRWGKNAIHGDFGYSWQYNIPVVQKFKEVIWYSVFLNVVTLLVETFISIPLGILAARKQYSKTDYAVTVLSMICISLPTFFLATLLKYIFSVKLGWFDLYGIVGRYYEQLDAWGKFLDMAKHLVLPVLTLSMLNIGGLMRYTRTNMLEVLNTDYIRTARAKGLSEDVVVKKHAFRNTLVPLVSYFSYLIPNMFSGSFITETLFQIPGIGYISYYAVIHGDIPFAMFYSVLIIFLTQISLLIADFMYAVVDPRVRIN
ncbi:MAG TPA: ABC transporter permease [Flexilinea sp.]|nr:ABC transporter permease [Flexilinea sp.]HOG21960.1 ABC transporter permease [Flexilinea sp.]HOG61663.1 ABC transporter permease [Flexilinea sp.]HOR55540.1 ABC transporter permease [Flexilinea sp.]HOU20269.1 ABC transporter permease [Flexilinea sp.]